MSIDAFPLCWPHGWPRAKNRTHSRFHATFASDRDMLLHEIKLMGGTQVVLSTNLPLKRDGFPYSGQAIPADPGVAIYFQYNGKQMVFACDKYRKPEENIKALAKTIEAIRGIERWGASDMMERAFTGFVALPAAKTAWWEVLGITKDASRDQIKTAFRELSKVHHPDLGGNHDAMAKLNKAYQEAME